MVRDDDGPPPEARPPLLADLIALCRSLNREGARYIVIGGMAIIQAGFVRATEDIDLLLDGSVENVARVKRALLDLPDQAAREMTPEDVDKYTVVRVADEFVVDLLKTAGGISFGDAATMVDLVTLEEVSITTCVDAVSSRAERAAAVPEWTRGHLWPSKMRGIG